MTTCERRMGIENINLYHETISEASMELQAK